MNPIEKLTEIFRQFPGIGPRQARRFVYFLLRKDIHVLQEFANLVPELKKSISTCKSCYRFFEKKHESADLCRTCQDSSRNKTELMILSHDVDMDSVLKSNAYSGYFFVLGGIVPILEKNPDQKIRINELNSILEMRKKEGLKEIILALDATGEGEHTGDFVKNNIRQNPNNNDLKITILGRGLSTGTELEYSDPETLKNAIKGRHE
jgi:recombination protein RecR